MTPHICYDVTEKWRSPACIEAGCVITKTVHPEMPAFIYQHGENPEHIFIVDGFERAVALPERMRYWLMSCHEYEHNGKLPE